LASVAREVLFRWSLSHWVELVETRFRSMKVIQPRGRRFQLYILTGGVMALTIIEDERWETVE